MARKNDGTMAVFLVTILGGIVVIGAWVVASSFEAKAFNRATGKTVSTWDAMWVDLRVQAEASE